MTPLERQQDAERDLWRLFAQGSTDRIALPDALRSVLSTAELVHHPAIRGVNHMGFAETHHEAYRAMAWQMIDDVTSRKDPKEIYGMIREAAEKSGLRLSLAPWEPANKNVLELA